MKSIQRQLSIGLVAMLLVVGLLLAQTSVWLFDKSLRSYLQSGLEDEAQTLLLALVRGPEGILLDSTRLSASYQRPYSGHYFRIDAPGQTWRSRSLWDSELKPSSTPGLQQALGDGPQAQKLLTYRGDYQRFGKPLSIYVAEDYTPVLKSVRRVQQIGLAMGIAALFVLLLLQRWLVHRALRPLEQTRKQIAQLQQGQRAELDNEVPEELLPLVGQINHLLAHTEETLKRSRNALGNLGHAMKTPLAVLFSLASREELVQLPEICKNLEDQLEQIEQRMGRELGRARLAGDVLPGAYFDCDRELPSLVSTLAMIHRRDINLQWHAKPGLRLARDREDVLELLGNLLDNACKWANSQVELRIETTAQGYCIWVDDDGPGIAEEKRSEVLSRGIRLDEQVSGHGLGLGIVRDIVEAWGGSIELEQSDLGGLRVQITLPIRPHI